MKKVFILVGQTASGKSDMAVKLASLFDDEIISCDSRQIYKELNVSSGKITKEEMRGIKHHMLDVVSLTNEYSVYEYVKETERIIEGLHKLNKLPILAGGTGFYMENLIYKNMLTEVPQDNDLTKGLEKMSLETLQSKLNAYNTDISTVDIQNKRRVIRAIEIIEGLGRIPKQRKDYKYDVCIVNLDLDKETLESRIEKRLNKRWGDIKKEAASLKDETEVLNKMGLECYAMAQINMGVDEDGVKQELFKNIKKYAKRQKTWFKRYDQRHNLSSYEDIEKCFIDFRNKP